MREIFQTHLCFFILLGGFVFCNIISLFLFWLDKRKSIKNKTRISEKTLLLWSVVGSVGALWGIYRLRHKTQHFYFPLVAWESLCLNILLVWVCW